jgi:signal transduction histidine kinase
VVRAALMTYRAEGDDRLLRPEDIDDLRVLIAPEARRRGVFLRWHSEVTGEVPLPATTIRQILLNLVLNACQATQRDGWVAVSVAQSPRAFVLRIDDDGPGMPPSAGTLLTEQATRPAPIGKGTGLGLWMTNRLIREVAGSPVVETRPEGGTRVTVTIELRRQMELDHVA